MLEMRSCRGRVVKTSDFHTGGPRFKPQKGSSALGQSSLSSLPSLLEETVHKRAHLTARKEQKGIPIVHCPRYKPQLVSSALGQSSLSSLPSLSEENARKRAHFTARIEQEEIPIVHIQMNGDLCHKISNFNLQNWCWNFFLCNNQITMIHLLYKGVWQEERGDILMFISPPPGTPPNWRRGHFGARESHAKDVLPRLHRDTINILIIGCERVIAVCVLRLPWWFAAYCAWSWRKGEIIINCNQPIQSR